MRKFIIALVAFILVAIMTIIPYAITASAMRDGTGRAAAIGLGVGAQLLLAGLWTVFVKSAKNSAAS